MKILNYPSLNGLRAISIILVLLCHLAFQSESFEELCKINWLAPITSFIKTGQFGVDVFFVISGFLITSVLLREETNSGSVSLKNFYTRRILRIFPAYYFLLLVYFFIQMTGYFYISKASWLTALTFTKYFNSHLDWYTHHLWSLSIEEHFYILWPLAFIYFKNLRKGVCIFFILLVPFTKIYLNFCPVAWIDEFSIFLRVDSIAIGCLFALYKDEIIKILSKYWIRIFYLSVLSLVILLYFPVLLKKMHLEYLITSYGFVQGTLTNILIALIMMHSIFGPRGLWFNMLNLRLINYIGVLSYSIYLWQQLIIYRTSYWVTHFPQSIIVILLLAMGSYHLIEKPFLKLKTKFSGQTGKEAGRN